MGTSKRPNLSCSLYTFDDNWDKLLNSLIDSVKDGTAKVQRTHEQLLTIEQVKSTKYIFFGKLPVNTYTTYEVWVGSKGCGYGKLYQVDGMGVEEHLWFAPSQSTMERLYDLEQSVDGKQNYEQLYLGKK